jgi:putative membrane protein
MGAADIVPGVSGGTVALVLGIYDQLIANVHHGSHGLRRLLSGDIAGFRSTLRQVEWVWLGSLLLGVLSAVAVLSSLLGRLLEEHPVRMAALFFGLVLGSVYVASRLLERVDPPTVGVVLAVAVGLFLLLGLRSDTEVDEGAAEVVTKSPVVFFVVGAIAICAMILPGVSGSFLLVMMGMYTEVLGAVNDRDVVSLVAFTMGAVTGLALFSTLLNWLLDRYHHWVLAAMIGLMLGSMRVLWPWPRGTDTTTLSPPSGDVTLPVLIILVGVTAVLAVDLVSRRFVTVAALDPDQTDSDQTMT